MSKSPSLARHLDDYLAIRRAFGYRLARPEKLLRQFLAYLEATGADYVTLEAALAWATQPASGSPAWWALRLSVVRVFGRHLHGLDPRHELIPSDVLSDPGHRATPYLYSEHDVAALMAAARSLAQPLRAITIESLVGLLAVTGMRIGEALRLDRADVDLAARVLTIRSSKFGKSREVHVHATTADALADYARTRDRLRPNPGPAFFISMKGTRLMYCNFHLAWLEVVRRAGLEPRSARCRPRPHDLRHSFAVRTLLGWYREGADVAAQMPLLSTHLGHVHPGATYWYLSAAPELLALVVARLEGADAGARP
ncbi:MAG: tyrosine-type recombinase/integrase [Acidimicrobiales bacterium]|nr:tyrosine-type recombinase/integrase [Acidimicrobiales bacterium]